MITSEQINKLPSDIGVYIFKNKDTILYIGKSINIKARVKSHFENAKLDRKESLIINNSEKIETIVVENEFRALLLESELIKKFHPKYNVIWKDGKSYLYIKITIKDDFPKVLLSRKLDSVKVSSDEGNLFFGPFSSSRITQSLINDIRRIIPFCTEKNISRTPCFYEKINLCSPCPNYIVNLKDEKIRKDLKKIYRKNIRKVTKILEGSVVEILNQLYRQLKSLIKTKKYEEAISVRNKIFRLEGLINRPTTENKFYIDKNSSDKKIEIFLREMQKFYPQLEKLNRIEAYDISNLKEDHQVGSMVVLTNGLPDKNQYRRFRIKNQKLKSDFERLNEVITRRFKNNWPMPDLIIVDGGRPQVRVVLKTLRKINQMIPVIGIAKNPDRIIISADSFFTIRFPQINPAFDIVKLIRDESHRFAKKYHLYLRAKDFLV